MPDEMDRVQAMSDRHTENALRTHASRVRTVAATHCQNLDCAEPIASARQALGARLCLDCQQEEEAHAAHFRQGRR